MVIHGIIRSCISASPMAPRTQPVYASAGSCSSSAYDARGAFVSIFSTATRRSAFMLSASIPEQLSSPDASEFSSVRCPSSSEEAEFEEDALEPVSALPASAAPGESSCGS